MNILTVNNLGKTFNGNDVIKDLSFNIKEKQIFGFLGKNGAGKTTTMKIILGFLKADFGEILVFDEPTAVLTDEEIQGLLKSFNIFKNAGKTIIFISHKLKEVEQVADYATVLRQGKVVGNFDMKNVKLSQIVEAMVGSSVKNIVNTLACERKDVIFELNNISTHKLRKNLHDVSFKIHAGEIFAIAGVEGNGQNELEEICSGMVKPANGEIKLNLKDKDGNFVSYNITQTNVYKRSKMKMSYIPADRHHHGLILDYSVADNAILRRL